MQACKEGMRTKLQEEPSGGTRARSASAHVRARGVPDRASSARTLKARELLSPGATADLHRSKGRGGSSEPLLVSSTYVTLMVVEYSLGRFSSVSRLADHDSSVRADPCIAVRSVAL